MKVRGSFEARRSGAYGLSWLPWWRMIHGFGAADVACATVVKRCMWK